MNSNRRLLRGLILAVFLALPGCVSTLPWVSGLEPAPNICQAHTFWDSRVQVTRDVVNNGQPLPGLAGRLYLMGPDFGMPQKGDGAVAVDLYDVSNAQAGVPPKRLERWELDPASVAKLLRHDKIGWGYTLFLPWSTYNPGISRVQLNVCYIPANGNPIYAEPAIVSLGNRVDPLTKTREVVGQNPAIPQTASGAITR